MKAYFVTILSLIMLSPWVQAQNNRTFPAEIRANSIWWFVQHTNYSELSHGEPVKIYFFGDKLLYHYFLTGAQDINGAQPNMHLYSGADPNFDFLAEADIIWVGTGRAWQALPLVQKHHRLGECWVITQEAYNGEEYPWRYLKRNGEYILDARGRKIKHNIWTLGSMANVHQHPKFGFHGNKDEIRRRNLSVSSQLMHLMQ